MKCYFKKHTLNFKQASGTSRGVLRTKDTYFIIMQNDERIALGECNNFKGLAYDDRAGYEQKLQKVCDRLAHEREAILPELKEWPSIQFGVETLLRDWEHGGRKVIFPEAIQKDGFQIPTNGLIWMGDKDFMYQQIKDKLAENYTSIKLKIGAIDFKTELELIQFIRKQFTAEEVEIRLDANGAYSYDEALEKLKILSEYGINYIEQPIKAGQWQEMAALCEQSLIDIALDEELIGIIDSSEKVNLLETISPQLLILKLALIGGFSSADEWKNLVENQGGDWVITSALESNVGLNAIAQYTALSPSQYAQGLGTGQLYTNNFDSPYTVDADGLKYHIDKSWDLSPIL